MDLPLFLSDDLSDISLDGIFQPSSPYHHPHLPRLPLLPLLAPPPLPMMTFIPSSVQQPLSVGHELRDSMEDFQDLCPSLVISPEQWRPTDNEDQDPSKTMEIPDQGPMDKGGFYDPIANTSWMSNWDDGFSGVEKGYGGGIVADEELTRMQSGGTVPFQMDSDEEAKVIIGSNDEKVKFKEKIMTTKMESRRKNGVAKVGSRVSGGGGGRRAAAAAAATSAAGPKASSSSSSVAVGAVDEERKRRRRQESNRRAAERYRTKQKASAADVATERHRLMDNNDQLSLENDRLRRHMSLIIASIQHHQQCCSTPFLLSEQFHLDTFHNPSQVASSQAEPFLEQFQIGGSTACVTSDLLVENRCTVKQNRSGSIDTSSVPFLQVVEPFLEVPLEEHHLDSFGELRVIGLYTNTPAMNR